MAARVVGGLGVCSERVDKLGLGGPTLMDLVDSCSWRDDVVCPVFVEGTPCVLMLIHSAPSPSKPHAHQHTLTDQMRTPRT